MFTSDERVRYALAFMKYDNKELTLDPWQQAYLASKARYIAILKSRRVGYSLITAVKGVVKSNDPERINYTKQYVSYNESDALEKIRYAEIFHDSMPVNVKKKLVVRNKATLEFQDVDSKTTSRLISLPCRPPRGKGGDIALDEMGIYLPRMSSLVYTAALSVIARGGCFEVGSTPLGKIGKFYEICTETGTYKGYQRFIIPWWFCGTLCKDLDGALREAKDLTTQERVYKYGSRELVGIFENESIEDFQQEHECLFVDSAESYITLELIYENTPGLRSEDEDKIRVLESQGIQDFELAEETFGRDIKVYHEADEAILNYNPEKHGSPLYLGFDVGKEKDAMSIIIIGRMENGQKRMFLRIEEHNKEFEWQKNVFRKLLDNLPIYRADIDKTGIGAPLFEELYKQYGDRVEGYQFTLESKEPLAMGVKFSLEQKELLLENDRGFHNQIHSIRRLPALGKHFRYDAERSEGLHADSFWSLALANYASEKVNRQANFYSEYAEKKRQITLDEIESSKPMIQSELDKAKVYSRGKSKEAILRAMAKAKRN